MLETGTSYVGGGFVTSVLVERVVGLLRARKPRLESGTGIGVTINSKGKHEWSSERCVSLFGGNETEMALLWCSPQTSRLWS